MKLVYEGFWNGCTIVRAKKKVLFNHLYFAAEKWKVKLLFVDRRHLLPPAES